MNYGTISEQERDAMTKGSTFVSLYFHDKYEGPAELVGRFYTEREALSAVHDYVLNELGGYFSDDFELRFYVVDDRDSKKHAGRKCAKCCQNYYI